VNLLEIVGVGMIGFFLGNLLFSAVGRWIATLYTIAKDRTKAGARSKNWKIASVTLLSSGPWMLVVVPFFAYHVHSKTWAMWLFAGVFTSILFFSVVTIHFARKASRLRRDNAA
jgi:hypothetical protein